MPVLDLDEGSVRQEEQSTIAAKRLRVEPLADACFERNSYLSAGDTAQRKRRNAF
jgi:hypothetical protein